MADLLTVTALQGAIVPGMRISYPGDSNRVRRVVRAPVTGSAFWIGLNIRPSRGFAKHTRRIKAAKR